jgi:hypothetical protein
MRLRSLPFLLLLLLSLQENSRARAGARVGVDFSAAETASCPTRFREAIELMKPIDADGRDLRYEDLAKKRKEALQKLRSAFGDLDPAAA